MMNNKEHEETGTTVGAEIGKTGPKVQNHEEKKSSSLPLDGIHVFFQWGFQPEHHRQINTETYILQFFASFFFCQSNLPLSDPFNMNRIQL